MKKTNSSKIVLTLTAALVVLLLVIFFISYGQQSVGNAYAGNSNVLEEESYSISTLPDDYLISENDGDDFVADIEEGRKEDKEQLLLVEEFYTNSQANGGGKMLWMLTVSYDGLNASDLLEQHGLYLVHKMTYSEDENDGKWHSFAHAFYLDEEEGYNSTGYLNGYIYSVQFAVVNVAPDDANLGAYENVVLTEENFIDISEIYYNLHFALGISQTSV
jgi:hypothetical protein